MTFDKFRALVRDLQGSGQSEAIAIGDVLDSWPDNVRTSSELVDGAHATLDEFIEIARALKKKIR